MEKPPCLGFETLENCSFHLCPMGLLWRFGKHKHLLLHWELGWQISAHSMDFFKGWDVQPRNVEFMMKMLPGFYLQQFQAW